MNQPTYQAVGVYQANTSTTPVELKCKFCGNLLLPVGNGQTFTSHGSTTGWLCYKCPNLVDFNPDLTSYSIIVAHNDHWYDICYLPISKQYVVHRFETVLIVQADQPNEHYSTVRVLVKQVESSENITPTNAKDKLLTILTFS